MLRQSLDRQRIIPFQQLKVRIDVVKQTTGKSTTTHISERIAIEAKALLLHTNWNVADVAYALGFEYPVYFNNFFKRITGTNPMSLRIVDLSPGLLFYDSDSPQTNKAFSHIMDVFQKMLAGGIIHYDKWGIIRFEAIPQD